MKHVHNLIEKKASTPSQKNQVLMCHWSSPLETQRLQERSGGDREGNTTQKNCPRFPKQFKPFTMWQPWLDGVKPNFNTNSGFSSPRMRSLLFLLYPTVKKCPTKTVTTHPR
jgi:hypothetical protein